MMDGAVSRTEITRKSFAFKGGMMQELQQQGFQVGMHNDTFAQYSGRIQMSR